MYTNTGGGGSPSGVTGLTDCDRAAAATTWPPPPPPPPSDPDSGCSANWVSGCSPIVINFANGSYLLTGAEAPVLFDINDSGHSVRIGWTAGGADEAFLCLDRNGNGTIDSGAEFFGTATRLKNGSRAANGFIALAEFDDNHDGLIDEHDSIWPQLWLWRDLNHDGISQSWEMMPVSESSLAAISLGYHWTGRRDASGNSFRYESRAWIRHGGKHPLPRPVYDIFFVAVP